MNVPLMQMTVTQMLHALTQILVSLVLVMMDILEMGLLAQVNIM